MHSVRCRHAGQLGIIQTRSNPKKLAAKLLAVAVTVETNKSIRRLANEIRDTREHGS